MLFDFHNYLYNIKNNDIYPYFNGYSTALLTRSDLKDNVLNHRMNFLIDYYTSEVIKNNGLNKSNYINYYLKNYKDDFKRTLLNSHENKNKNNEEIDITEDFDKDVRDHYLFITSKPPPEPEINYDEIDEKFYREEEEKRLEKELEKENNYYYDEDDDYYYDEYYEDDYEDDYYSLNRDDY
jgi:hypothetical protein